jgi:tetrapyrrole methylase family protein / MazG family protein
MPTTHSNTETVQALIDLMAALRAPEGGCPWDRKQTHETLKTFVLEEAYEVAHAIEQNDMVDLREELGDLLFQVVFQSRLTEEAGLFDFYDVVRTVTEKMRRRHPHVFGEQKLETAEEVLGAWEEQKKTNEGKGMFDGLPAILPALLKAFRVQEKAGRVGFDWPDVSGPMAKLREELAEFEEAVASGDAKHVEEEIGDLFFSVVNVARMRGINPEFALNGTTDKFIRRFKAMEKLAADRNLRLTGMALTEMDKLWDEVKASE